MRKKVYIDAVEIGNCCVTIGTKMVNSPGNLVASPKISLVVEATALLVELHKVYSSFVPLKVLHLENVAAS